MQKRHFKDIEHRYDPDFYETVVQPGVHRYLESVFEEIPHAQGLEHLASIPKDTNRVYIALHKSHLDYLLIPYNLLKNGAQPPAVAGGDNLFKRIGKWDFDKIIRKVRGYKIIRNPKSRRHHMQIMRQLREYTAHMLANGEDIMIFPEAGRSYDGGTKEFSDGAIRVLVSAAQQAGRKIAFVPVVVSYERVPEDRFFESFQGYKDAPTLARRIFYYAADWPAIYAQRFNPRKHAFGQAAVRFGKPHICDPENNEHYSDRTTVRRLLTQSCNDLVEATPTSLVAHAIEGRRELSLDELLNGLEFDLSTMDRRNVFSSLIPDRDPRVVLDRALTFLNKPFRRFLTVKGDQLQVKRPDVIRYYANIIDHHFGRVLESADAKAF